MMGTASAILAASFLLMASLTGTSVVASERFDESTIDIPAGTLAEALSQLAKQTGADLVYRPEQVAGLTTPGVKGALTAADALHKLLAGTPLRLSTSAAGAYMISTPKTSAQWDGWVREGEGSFRLAQTPSDTGGEPRNGEEELGEVVVTGSYTRQSANSATGLNMSLRETPQSVTVMSHERMEDQDLNEISDVLRQAVGVTYDGSTLGSDYYSYYSRGFPITNYQVGGVPRPSGIYGFDLTTSDMISYDRVEIIRGATGLMNGVGNPSASINLIRKRPKPQLSGGMSLQGGTWNQYRLESEISGPLIDSGSVRGLLTGAYEESDSHMRRAHLNKKAVYGSLEVDLTPRSLMTLGVEYQDFENKYAPRGALPLFFTDGSETKLPRSSNPAAPWSSLSSSNLYLFGSLEYRFSSGWLLKFDVEHSEPDYDDTIGYLADFIPFAPDGSGAEMWAARWSSKLKQDFASAYLQGAFDWKGRKQDLVFGVSYILSKQSGPDYCGWWCESGYIQSIDNVANLFAGRDTLVRPDFTPTGGFTGGHIEHSSAYTALRLRPADRLAVIVGARLSNWRQMQWEQPEGGVREVWSDNSEQGKITPYLGALFDLTRTLSLYASATQIFEPQSIYTQDIDGNVLEALEGTNYEMGAKAEFFEKRLALSLGIYRVQQDNYPVETGQINQNGEYVYRPEDGTKSEGFEIEVAGEILPGWQMVGGFSRAEAESSNGSPLIGGISKDQFKMFSSYKLRGSLANLTVGGNVLWQSRAKSSEVNVFGEFFRQDSLLIVDLMTKYEVGRKLSLQVNANNIFDKTYYTGLAYSATYGLPRNITAGVNYTF